MIPSSLLQKEYDYLIVGCGLSGSVLAERLASKLNKRILIIDKRDHIGGNCYDSYDCNGILSNLYGAHLFHTNSKAVWDYVQKFSKWIPWEHRVLASVDTKLVPIPVCIPTVNSLFKEDIKTDKEMDIWLKKNQVPFKQISNSEEMALSRVGKKLYHLLFYNYTWKQWNRKPSELGPEVLARIPVRNNFDTRYFCDKYQALPEKGYSIFLKNLLKNSKITTLLNTDYFEIKDKIKSSETIYTGPIDHYFSSLGFPKLEYRSIRFEKEQVEQEYYQNNSVINYPSLDYPFTRIIEYKHFLNQKSKYTSIVKEYSTDKGEPYYPIPNAKNLDLYQYYQRAALDEKGVHFLGRLANYKYINMDEAILNSLQLFDRIQNKLSRLSCNTC